MRKKNGIQKYLSITKYSCKVNSINQGSCVYVCVFETSHFEFGANFRRALKTVVDAESLFTGQCLLLSRDLILNFALHCGNIELLLSSKH